MVKVKNINNTSDERYSYPKVYGSWKKFGEEKSGCDFPTHCKCHKCENFAEVGAHV